MSEVNPYAAPQSLGPPALPGTGTGVVQAAGGVWRDGKILVMHKDATLPLRCIKTGGPADGGEITRKLSWHHPAIALTILIAWPVYLILALVLSKRATVRLPVSVAFRRRRRNIILFGLLGLALAVLLFVGGILLAHAQGRGQGGMEWVAFSVIGSIVLMVFSTIGLLIGARLVTPKKITDTHVWLSGVHPDYLAELPALPGPV